MLRQSLRTFVKTLIEKFPNHNFEEALSYLTNKEFHKRLRDEIIMVPIPKFKIKKNLCQFSSNYSKEWVIEKQTHVLEWAIDRVNFVFF